MRRILLAMCLVACGPVTATPAYPSAMDTPPAVRAADATEEALVAGHIEQLDAAWARNDLHGVRSHGHAALAVLDATLGADHPLRSLVASRLGNALHFLGADEEAADLMAPALASLEAHWATDHPQLRGVAAQFVPVLLARDVPPHAWPESLSLWLLLVQSHREPAPGDDLQHAAWLDAAALIADSQGYHEFASTLWRRVLAIREAGLPGSHAEVGSAYNRLAASLSRLGDVDHAERHARRALAIFDALPGAPVPARATVLGTLARVHELRGRPLEAEALFRESLAQRRALSGNAHALVVDATLDLAGFLQVHGRAAEAADLYVGLLAPLASHSRGGPRLLRAMLGVANGLSDPAECRAAGDQLLAVSEGLAPHGFLVPQSLRMQLAESHGRLLACQGRYTEAAKRFDQAFQQFLSLHTAANSAELGMASARYALVLSESAEAADEAGRFASQAVWIARSRRRQGFADSDAPAFADAVTRAVHVVGDGDPMAIAFQARLAAAWAQAGRGDSFAPTYRNEAFMAAQDLEVSGAAHALAQTQARVAAGGGALGDLVRRQQDLSARAVALDRAALDATASGERGRADALGTELDALGKVLSDLDARLAAEFPEYASLVSPRALSIPALQERLVPGEAVVLLVPSRGDMHVFAVAKDQATWHRAEGAAPIVAAHVERLRCQVDPATCGAAVAADVRAVSSVFGAAVAQGGRPFDRTVAHALHELLLAPVEPALAGASTLFVTASGPLASLPLGVLVTTPPLAGEDDADPAVLARTAWLADRFALVTLPAVSAFRPPHTRGVVRDETPAGDVFVGFGAPLLDGMGRAAGEVPGRGDGAVFGDAGDGGPPVADVAALRAMAPLPGSRVELEAIAGLFGDEAVLRLGEAATEAGVKASRELARARVVAFATHGLLPREVRGMDEPGLVFTPPVRGTADDDGVLTASEAARLDLAAEWVILSACNTAAQDGSAGGESLSGLARAFLHAGAGALLASHWRVADDATSALTTQTLALQRDGAPDAPAMTRSQALQAAMRAIRTGVRPGGAAVPGWKPGWAHPAMWAPFVVISDRDESGASGP